MDAKLFQLNKPNPFEFTHYNLNQMFGEIKIGEN